MTSFSVLTLFPDMFPGPLGEGLAGKALEKGLFKLCTYQLRDYATDAYGSVDDEAFGGGAGMVLRPDIIHHALQALVPGLNAPRLIFPSPRGKPFTQDTCRQWFADPRPFLFLCGRYEGVDQRVLDHWDFEEWSLGDFILMGGEVATLAMIEAYIRLIPDILGNADSLEDESFSTEGLLAFPQYTRPRTWEGQDVPPVLLSGHHKDIAKWRRHQSEETTKLKRPDLWDKRWTQAQKHGTKKKILYEK